MRKKIYKAKIWKIPIGIPNIILIKIIIGKVFLYSISPPPSKFNISFIIDFSKFGENCKA